MNGWVVLRSARITLLIFLVLICIAWAALFAIFLSHEWSFSSLPQKIIVLCFLILDVVTAILLYLMAVMHVCPGWDVIWMFAILVAYTVNSVLFTHYKSSFSCRGFDTETLCKDLIFTIFIGCWVFSGTTLCFAIALGVMACIPRPVDPEAVLESLPLARTEGDGLPSNPDLFKAESPTDERRKNSLTPLRTGLPVVTYNNERSLPSPPGNTPPVNSIHGETIPWEPPHTWQGFQSKNPRPGNENRTRGGTISTTRNAPGGSTSIGSAPRRAESFSQKYSPYSPIPRLVPIHSRALTRMVRPVEGGKNTPAAEVGPNRTSTFPKLRRDALSPIPLRNPPPLRLVTLPHDRATEYPPRVFSALNNSSVLTPPWDDSQQAYPDPVRKTMPEVYSFHPAPENVNSVLVEPPPYGLLPSVPSPRTARFQDLSAFYGPNDTSAASFATGGSNAPVVRSVSQPRKVVQRSGEEGTAHDVGVPPVKKVRFSRRSSDGQVLDQTQWWGLVRGAATKP